LGITFSIADLKGLLTDYHFADTAAWSFGDDSDAAELNPADFHRMLLTWLTSTGSPRNPSDGTRTGSSMSGGFAHPARIWYPQSRPETRDGGLVSAALDRHVLDTILAGPGD
jgi:hypothetical protein